MKKLVYKPLSNTIQLAQVSKDGTCTVGNPVDMTHNALNVVATFLSEQPDNDYLLKNNHSGKLYRLSLEELKGEI